MKIQYPSEHKWLEPVWEDPMAGLGKNNRARLRSTLKLIAESTITHSFEPLTPEILTWFTPMYASQIGGKNNPKLHDIYATTIGKDSPHPYYALILRESGEPIGATIFSQRTNILSIAYRIYPPNWNLHTLQSSPSLYTEFLINRHAFELGYKKISHGKDRNPYGINANIGLALFKLSVGCFIYLPSTKFEIKELDLDAVEEDLLVFALNENPTEKRITQGYLCVNQLSLVKYENVTKYPNQIKIDVVLRS